MIKEARFSDNMGAGIEQAHEEIISNADVLARYALQSTPAAQPSASNADDIDDESLLDELLDNAAEDYMKEKTALQQAAPHCRTCHGKGGWEESECGEGCCRSGVKCDDCNGTGAAPSVDLMHPDDRAVDLFAALMKVKLSRKRKEGRGGWEGCSEETPSMRCLISS